VNSPGVYIDARTLRFERQIPGTAEQVWSYLVEPERMAQWLSRGEIEPRVGGIVVLFQEEDSPTRGVVTVWDPPRSLAYTWSSDSTNSEVSFELTPAGDGVKLVLTHRHLPLGDEAQVGWGWHACLDALAIALAGAEAAEVKAAWNGSSEQKDIYEQAIASIEAKSKLTPEQYLRDIFQASAWHKHLGFELIEVTQKRLSARVDLKPELVGGRGTLHGGAVSALIDSLGAFHAAIAAQRHMQTKGDHIQDKRAFRIAALDHHVDFLSPLIGKSFTASTLVLHTGDNAVRVRADVTSDTGVLVATASGNFVY
jgi:uncharacterized protein (TIGR00369 family)